MVLCYLGLVSNNMKRERMCKHWLTCTRVRVSVSCVCPVKCKCVSLTQSSVCVLCVGCVTFLSLMFSKGPGVCSASTCTSTHTHTHTCAVEENSFSRAQARLKMKINWNLYQILSNKYRENVFFFLHLYCVCIIVCMYCSICVPYLTHITLGRKHKAPPTLVHCTVAEEQCFHLEKNAATEARFCLTCRHDGGTVVRLYLCGCGCGPCR